jgi:hypothetical protein
MSNITDRRAVADKLREARALIERGWTQGHDAIDRAGEDIDPRMDEAACWCINGALYRAGDRDDGAERLLEQAIGHSGEEDFELSPVIDWNDAPERTQAEVLAAFDKAITLADSSQ